MSFSVFLSDAEMATCRMLGEMRSLVARGHGVKDRKMADLAGYEIDIDGMISEYAFCKHFNIFPDLIPSPRSGSCDCIYKGKRIDIKSTRHKTGKLLATTKRNEDVDIYVLAIINGNEVIFPGYATAKQLIDPNNLSDLGYGSGYALQQHQLSKWKEHD